MIRLFALEKFKEITIDPALTLRYAISNYGRLVSFTNKIEEGRLLKGSLTDGYRMLRYKVRQEGKLKDKHVFIYKLVANAFLEKTSEEQVFILHLDRNRSNDFIGNLKWATAEERLEHNRNSPYVIAARKKLIAHKIKSDGPKLTATQVMFLKKKLLDPFRKTRISTLAKQFGVSEMQLHRIKSGENWGHIKV
jgi:hypothetical protein